MAEQGKVTIEIKAATTKELKAELEKLLKEVDKLKIDPGTGITNIPGGQAWKVSYET